MGLFFELNRTDGFFLLLFPQNGTTSSDSSAPSKSSNFKAELVIIVLGQDTENNLSMASLICLTSRSNFKKKG